MRYGDKRFTPAMLQNTERIQKAYMDMNERCKNLLADVARKNAHDHVPPIVLTQTKSLEAKLAMHATELNIAISNSAGNEKQIKALFAETKKECNILLKKLQGAIPDDAEASQ